jgi:hypothetical protein
MRKLLTQSISDIASHEFNQVHFFLKTLVFLPFDAIHAGGRAERCSKRGDLFVRSCYSFRIRYGFRIRCVLSLNCFITEDLHLFDI